MGVLSLSRGSALAAPNIGRGLGVAALTLLLCAALLSFAGALAQDGAGRGLGPVSDDDVIAMFDGQALLKFGEPIRASIMVTFYGEDRHGATEVGRRALAQIARLETAMRFAIDVVPRMENPNLLIRLHRGSETNRDLSPPPVDNDPRPYPSFETTAREIGAFHSELCQGTKYLHRDIRGIEYSQVDIYLERAAQMLPPRAAVSGEELDMRLDAIVLGCVHAVLESPRGAPELRELRLRLLYDGRVKAGMQRAEYEPIFREILRDLRRQSP